MKVNMLAGLKAIERTDINKKQYGDVGKAKGNRQGKYSDKFKIAAMVFKKTHNYKETARKFKIFDSTVRGFEKWSVENEIVIPDSLPDGYLQPEDLPKGFKNENND